MKIPDSVLTEFEQETEGLQFGEVNLTLFLRDGRGRYEVSRRRTLPPDVKSVDLVSAYKEDNKIEGKQGAVFRKKR
jgi:hypothetical protein